VSTGTSVEFGNVSIILKRSDAGEAVFTEHRRGQVIFVVPFAILCVPGTFIFFLLPDSGGLGTDILMSVISVAMLSMVVGVAVSEALKHRNRLTVTSEAITFVRWSDGRETALRRGDGDRLLIIPNNLGAVLPRDRILTQLGAGRVIGLNGFFRGVVRRAHYRERQAKDYAYWRAADAYRFADKAQRSFAALATSPEENAARLTEADRFQAKAESAKAHRRTIVTR
jgi:hypothetical protein